MNLNSAVLAVKRRVLLARRRAYIALFFEEDGLPNVHQRLVLADLRKFCRADESCFDADPRKHAILEGRREVWLRIQQHLRLTERDIEKFTQMETYNGD